MPWPKTLWALAEALVALAEALVGNASRRRFWATRALEQRQRICEPRQTLRADAPPRGAAFSIRFGATSI